MRSARIKAAKSYDFSNESSFCLEHDGATLDDEGLVISRVKLESGELVNLVKYDPHKTMTSK